MKRYMNTALLYAVFAMAGGVFYREFTKFNGFTGKTRGEPIDYIFTSRDLLLREVELRRDHPMEGFPSDHYPVVAQVEL